METATVPQDETRISVEPTVTYTVKEKLDSLDHKFDNLISRMLDKMEAQDGKIDDVAGRVTAIEHEKTNRNAIRENWFALVALLTGMAAGLGTLGLWLSQVHHG